MYYVNENIKNTKRIFPQQGRYAYKRYDMNENPEGLPKAFVDSVLKEITPEFLSVYPEPDRFLNKYASFVGVSYDKRFRHGDTISSRNFRRNEKRSCNRLSFL